MDIIFFILIAAIVVGWALYFNKKNKKKDTPEHFWPGDGNDVADEELEDTPK